MIQRQLDRELQRVAKRIRRLRLWTALTCNWLIAAAIGGVLIGLNRTSGWYWPPAVGVLAGVAVAGASVCWLLICRRGFNMARVAKRIEAKYHDLDSRLLAAVEQQPALNRGRMGFLQESIIRQVVVHSHKHWWGDVVSVRRFFFAWSANVAALCILGFVLVGLSFDARPGKNLAAIETNDENLVAVGEFQVAVEPGDSEVERGTSLLVLARFAGDMPADARLVYRFESGEQNTVTMSRSLDDPLFAARIDRVGEPLTYHVEFDSAGTETFHVTVFDYPKLDRMDARLRFPDFASQEEKLVEDVLTISAVEGTEVTLLCRLNKPVAGAKLVTESGESVELSLADDHATVYTTTMTLQDTVRYRLQLVDDRGRENKHPPEIVLNVTRNAPADLKIAWPARDTEVSPLEEMEFRASAQDDFGLVAYGIQYSIGNDPPQEIVLGQMVPGKQKQPLEHQFDFEALQAEPDQLLTYTVWAEDAIAGNQRRRTYSDMYFAEVRHFEEIFRQGEQPAGGSQQQQQQQQGMSGNAAQAQQLAELQKQIINATWKIVRRETGTSRSPKFIEDVGTVMDSQNQAQQQAEQLAAELEDAESKQHADAVLRHMAEAVEHLMKTIASEDVGVLDSALGAERAAYAALLKLRAREHRVIRSQQQQGSPSGSQSGQRSGQQLEQLELDNEENRYETQRTASDNQQQQQQQQREMRQSLNRLRELAQRQNDLNDQLKQLQTALEEAKTAEEEEEIRRQLKRLREEQQQILRDTDELRNRMQQSADQQAMNEANRRLEQTRDNVRRASEALEEGRVSQAVAAGERAGREFEQLRDEFRKQASGQFTETMEEMREDAETLERQQRELGDQLEDVANSRSRSLRDSGERQELSRGLQQQQDRLDDLLDRIQQTVREAEQAEPLLSKELYDTFREAKQQRVDEALKATAELFDLGVLPDALRIERQAREGIEHLSQGVKRAADKVLGDEETTLRRAEEELQRLSEQLNNEIAEATGQAGRPQPGQEPGSRNANDQQQEPSDGQGPQAGSEAATEGRRNPSRPESPRGEADSNASPTEENPQNPGAESSSPGAKEGGTRGPSQNNRPSTEPGNEPSYEPGNEPGDNNRGERPAADPRGDRPPSSAAAGKSPKPSGSPDGRGGPSKSQSSGPGSLAQFLEMAAGPGNPLTGEGFRDWSDGLRDVEEMLSDPQLRDEVARVRDRARGMRAEFKRHSKEPNWNVVREMIAGPLEELRQRIAEELLRRQSKDALVPLDRDPIPPEFEDAVRKYYEQLGTGK